jgi:hypothetical protein
VDGAVEVWGGGGGGDPQAEQAGVIWVGYDSMCCLIILIISIVCGDVVEEVGMGSEVPVGFDDDLEFDVLVLDHFLDEPGWGEGYSVVVTL